MTDTSQKVTFTRPLVMGLASLSILLIALGGWSTSTTISGAVLARGEVRVEGPTRVISHETGGILAQVNVENGDRVAAGDVLLVLEETVLRARLEGVEDRLFGLLANEARLNAQSTGSDELHLSDHLATFIEDHPQIEHLLDRQQEQLNFELEALSQSREQQSRIIAQIKEQIGGVRIRLQSLDVETTIIGAELENAHKLLDQGLDRQSNVSRLERDKALKNGEIGMAKALIGEKEQRILELGMSILGLEAKFRQTALEKLERIQEEKSKLLVERAELLVQLRKLIVHAPIDGVVYDSKLAGVGSLVVNNLPILGIVPATEIAVAQVQVSARDIDQVFIGQDARIQLQAYSSRSMPVFVGKVIRISGDTIVKKAGAKPVYEVQIELPISEIQANQKIEMVNGMPLTAFLTTTDQTPLEYVMRPLTNFFALSFRDT